MAAGYVRLPICRRCTFKFPHPAMSWFYLLVAFEVIAFEAALGFAVNWLSAERLVCDFFAFDQLTNRPIDQYERQDITVECGT